MNSIDPEFQRLEVLRAFKRWMTSADATENVSPFDDRISTAHGQTAGADLPAIHAEIRQRIKDAIEMVRNGAGKSQVILLAGDAGTGKTHLLRTFQSREQAEELGYVYVGGSNH
jgi:predicted ATP-dependent serine protease